MTRQREHWPLAWTVTLRASESLVTIFDLVEIRSTVDTHRVGVELAPVGWIGRTDDDPTFVAGLTPIRAVHFTQLRAAIAELYRAADLEALPEFSEGPIVAGARVVKLADPLDLRGWVERYETLRPDLAARVVRKYGRYSVPGLDAETARGKLTEMWDGAGFSRYFYDAAGRVVRELRGLDSHEYWTGYAYDDRGRVSALTYPDGERVSYRYNRSGEIASARSNGRRTPGELVGPAPTGEQVTAEVWERTGETNVRYDPRGRPVLLGNPARPILRLAYDGTGKLVKRLDDRGTVHLIGDHYER
ncbi:MAG: RHS repeat protein, partial [Chloroflexi bacterium]|nr:RHS repeat protein [Chloroflexota bacterium]